jgi:hypothetical protein
LLGKSVTLLIKIPLAVVLALATSGAGLTFVADFFGGQTFPFCFLLPPAFMGVLLLLSLPGVLPDGALLAPPLLFAGTALLVAGVLLTAVGGTQLPPSRLFAPIRRFLSPGKVGHSALYAVVRPLRKNMAQMFDYITRVDTGVAGGQVVG